MLSLLLASVFLNGVNIDSLRSQTFEKCKTVKIDERGDVHLDCPGYQVETQQPQPAPLVPSAPSAPPAVPAAVASAITKHYWLVGEDPNPALAEDDPDGVGNSEWIRK